MTMKQQALPTWELLVRLENEPLFIEFRGTGRAEIWYSEALKTFVFTTAKLFHL